MAADTAAIVAGTRRTSLEPKTTKKRQRSLVAGETRPNTKLKREAAAPSVATPGPAASNALSALWRKKSKDGPEQARKGSGGETEDLENVPPQIIADKGVSKTAYQEEAVVESSPTCTTQDQTNPSSVTSENDVPVFGTQQTEEAQPTKPQPTKPQTSLTTSVEAVSGADKQSKDQEADDARDPTDNDVEVSDVDSDDKANKRGRRPRKEMASLPAGPTTVMSAYLKKVKPSDARVVSYNFSASRAKIRDVSGATRQELTHGSKVYRHQKALLHKIVAEKYVKNPEDLVDLVFLYGGYGAGIIRVIVELYRADRLEAHREVAATYPDHVPGDTQRELWLLCMSRKNHGSTKPNSAKQMTEEYKTADEGSSDSSSTIQSPDEVSATPQGRVIRKCRRSVLSLPAGQKSASSTKRRTSIGKVDTKSRTTNKPNSSNIKTKLMDPSLKSEDAESGAKSSPTLRVACAKSRPHNNSKTTHLEPKKASKQTLKANSKQKHETDLSNDNEESKSESESDESFEEAAGANSSESSSSDDDDLVDEQAEPSEAGTDDEVDKENISPDKSTTNSLSTRKGPLPSSKKLDISREKFKSKKERQKKQKSVRESSLSLIPSLGNFEANLINRALGEAPDSVPAPPEEQKKVALVDNEHTRRLRERVADCKSVGVKYDDFFDPSTVKIVEGFHAGTADVVLAAKSAETKGLWVVLGAPSDVRLHSPAALTIERKEKIVRTNRRGAKMAALKLHRPSLASKKPRPLCSEISSKTYDGMEVSWDTYDGLDEADLAERRARVRPMTGQTIGRKSLRASLEINLAEHRMVSANRESRFTPIDCCIYCGWSPASLWLTIAEENRDLVSRVFIGTKESGTKKDEKPIKPLGEENRSTLMKWMIKGEAKKI